MMNARACAVIPLMALGAAAAPPGIFTGQTDVGTVLHAGSTQYDAVKGTYTISGSGENMWFAKDAFQFAWKKLSGDLMLTATISFVGTGAEAHRKAVLMIRQSLDADSAYVDVARHGDGLTSMQARDEKGANTTEIQSAVKAPLRVRIAKRGDYFYFWVAGEGEELRFAGGSMRVTLQEPFYVGLGVCSHNKDAVEKAVFSNVELTTEQTKASPVSYSTLEIVPLTGDRKVVYVTPGRIESPVWTADGAALVFERGGRRERISIAGGTPEIVPRSEPPVMFEGGMEPAHATGPPRIVPLPSPDGQHIAFLSSASSVAGAPGDNDVLLQVESVADQRVRVLAKLGGGRGTLGAPWSPDGGRLVFVSYQRLAP